MSHVAQWLVSSAGCDALARVERELAGGEISVTHTRRLRNDFSPEQTAALLECVVGRRVARGKFLDSGRWFLTRKCAEQATDFEIAQVKSVRFAGFDQAVDIGCGAGGDTAALARTLSTVAVERDLSLAVFAEHNVPQAHVLAEDAFAPDARWLAQMSGRWAWHVDPDRRATGHRATALESMAPGPDQLRELLARSRHGAIKLAPATTLDDDAWPTCEREWLSRGGECRQQVVWFGDLARTPGKRRATVVQGDQTFAFVGAADVRAPVATRLGNWLVEPDAAVLAARLQDALALSLGLELVAQGIGYLTGDAAPGNPSPLVDPFEMLEDWPFDERKVGDELRRRNVGVVEIKKRGVDVSPENLRARWKLQGENQATIILTPRGESIRALLCRRAKPLAQQSHAIASSD